MKKIKVLTSLVGLTGLSMGLVPTIASCGCSTGYSVEFTSKVKEKEFSNVSGGISYTFKVADGEVAKATKIQIVDLKVDGAETTSVSGLIKSTYDSAGNIKVVINTETLMTQWPNAEKVEFSLLFTNKQTKNTTTIDGFVLTAPAVPVVTYDLTPTEFSLCPWSVIIDRTDWLYNTKITLEEFCASFYIDSAQTPATELANFIGLERKDEAGLVMNNQKHTVRVIDTQHETDLIVKEDGTVSDVPAIFTFELVTLLSGADGNKIKTIWDLQLNNNYNYTNSVLRWNLNGAGSGSKPSSEVWDESAISMIPSDILSAIKTVQKHVATTSSYTDTTYKDKLFPLTFTEMGGSSSTFGVKVEGKAYTYWTTHNTDANKVKKDVNNTPLAYWLVSPSTWDRGASWDIYETGMTTYDNIYNSVTLQDVDIGVSFAFCI